MPYDLQLGIAGAADMAYGGNAVQQLQNLRQAQAQQEEYQAGKARAEATKGILAQAGSDPAKLKEAANAIMQTGDYETANKLLQIAVAQEKEARLQQQQQIMQDALAKNILGKGGDADKLATLGVMSNSPQLMQLAQFKQAQENRAQDEANRIAAEERQTQKEQNKATKQASIPGYDILSDVVIDPATARASRELNSAIPTYENAIKKITKLIDKYGSTVGAGTDVNEAEQAMADLMNAERAVNNTGVLNVGEIPVLQQLYSTFDPRNPMNLGKSKEEMKASALSYLADRKGLIQGKLQSIGYIPKQGKQEDNAPSAMPSRDALMQEAIRRGLIKQ